MLQEARVLVSTKSLLSVRIQADDNQSRIPVLAERFRQLQRYKKGKKLKSFVNIWQQKKQLH
jgi:hypothetical protein